MDRDEISFGGSDNRCFGCSPHNERGLRMRFQRVAPGVVESRYVAEPHLCGAPGVVHGGIQAALLDEAMGVAIHSALGGDDGPIVTVDFRLRYRRPAPAGEPLVVRGTFLRRDGAHAFALGRILDGKGVVCTEAEARWKRIELRARG
jgi:uncharacterized protein (TIGR00369 family)